MICEYSRAPFGDTGFNSVHCRSCRRHVAIVPSPADAKILVDVLRDSEAMCVEQFHEPHAQADLFSEGAA